MHGALVKVLATLGPSTMDPGVVAEMARLGVSGFRINLSHGDRSVWDKMLRSIHGAEEAAGRRLAIIADLEGPRVRLGSFKPIQVGRGDTIRLSTEGDGVPVDRPEFFDAVEPGDEVLIADGRVVLRITGKGGGWAEGEVLAGSVIEPRKGVVIRGKDLPLPPLTEKDLRDLEYVASRDFSHVMVSYANDPGHVEAVREELRSRGAGHIRVIAKIETPRGVLNAGRIAGRSDGVVVARGDLGMHYPLEEIPWIQARIIREARDRYKPVILATELLPSMIDSPVPVRSDVVDVYTGARSGVDALLLTSETAVGRYPVEAVRWLTRIIESALRDYEPYRPPAAGPEYRLARGIVELVENLDGVLVLYSRSGTFPGRISAFRPGNGYYVGVPTVAVARSIAILWGSNPHIVPAQDYQEGLDKTVKLLEGELDGTVVMAAWSREQDYYHVRIRLHRGPQGPS